MERLASECASVSGPFVVVSPNLGVKSARDSATGKLQKSKDRPSAKRKVRTSTAPTPMCEHWVVAAGIRRVPSSSLAPSDTGEDSIGEVLPPQQNKLAPLTKPTCSKDKKAEHGFFCRCPAFGAVLAVQASPEHEVLVCFHEGIPNPNSPLAHYLLLIVFSLQASRLDLRKSTTSLTRSCN